MILKKAPKCFHSASATKRFDYNLRKFILNVTCLQDKDSSN